MICTGRWTTYRACLCIYVNIYFVYMFVYICVCVCIYTHIYLHIHIYSHIICTYTCIFIYVCMYLTDTINEEWTRSRSKQWEENRLSCLWKTAKFFKEYQVSAWNKDPFFYTSSSSNILWLWVMEQLFRVSEELKLRFPQKAMKKHTEGVNRLQTLSIRNYDREIL